MQYLGRVTIRANGEVWDTKPGASCDLGGIQRDSVVTDQAMGFTEIPKPGMIECEIALKRGLTLQTIRDLKDATAVFECDIGQRFIFKDAYTSETLNISSGAVKVKLMALPAEELVS